MVGSSLRVGVVGTGYLGSVHAACLAQMGHDVVAVDTNSVRIDSLAQGKPDIFEPGLDDLLRQVLPTGRLIFTTSFEELTGADVIFVCVGTPFTDGVLDTSSLDAVTESIAPFLDNQTLVVGKSTVPVGTAERLARSLEDLVGRPVRLAWNPEFLREGHALDDTLVPSRLVYGVDERTAALDTALLDAVYASCLAAGVPRLVMDLASSELVKGAANAFLATKISFINAVADVCEASGADVTHVAAALGLDDRIGAAFLGAGLGFGGGCLPKDIRGFAARAEELGAPMAGELLGVVDKINLDRRDKVVRLVEAEVGTPVRGKVVAILGFAFKPGSDDIRDSASLGVAERLSALGAEVRLHDPEAVPDRIMPGWRVVHSAEEAVAGADVVLHLTEWPDYRALDPGTLLALASGSTIIDARNRLDTASWRGAGWRVLGVGRPHEE